MKVEIRTLDKGKYHIEIPNIEYQKFKPILSGLCSKIKENVWIQKEETNPKLLKKVLSKFKGTYIDPEGMIYDTSGAPIGKQMQLFPESPNESG